MDNFFSPVLDLINDSLRYVSSIFPRFLSGKFFSLFMSVFFVVVAFRFIIAPLVGVSGSDGVIGKEEKDKQARQAAERRRKYE